MARPKSDGLAYFPFDVNFFSDPKIRSVRAHYGADGVTLYIYLLCEIYRSSYFVKADDEFIDCTAADLGMSVEKTRQMISFFCKRSLFDSKLLMTDTVLTATSVQHRYQEARKGAKRDIYVDAKLWLLEKAETLGFIKVRPVSGFSEKNEDFSEKNHDNSEKYATKESKVKEKKGKDREERIALPNSLSPFSDMKSKLVEKYGANNVAEYERRYKSWSESRHIYSQDKMYDIIFRWMEQDGVQKPQASSFDVDEVVGKVMKKYSEG